MRLALYQNDSKPSDVAHQLASLRRVARDLRGEADLLVTPELFASGYRLPPAELQRLAEPAAGPFVGALADIAREAGLAILCGFPERDGALVFNSAIAIGRDGATLALYRKLHLPSDDERAAFAAGGRIVTFDLLGFHVAPLICYDIEFPEAARACARAGAELILVPTALRRHWHEIARQVIPVRARESGAFLAYCNFAGSESDWDYAGLSSICGPDGAVLALAGEAEGVIVATLNHGAVAAARARLPYLRDCRFGVSGPD
ncbi:putative amidohydrolase [Dongia mobilis]|uniref:Putative amidohydrolase n=1 Tax=Dongia mobilis TaxID=578943 RepID=A0A4R6X2F2_9PROT|nr:carbon-nitrogen hydrolase family protein [Dongia mobilis]TDQ85454.1 putative amidohydrolase [Dongia mobilis]